MNALRVALLTINDKIRATLLLRLQSLGHQAVEFSQPAETLGQLYMDPPDIILADLSTENKALTDLLHEIKQDSYFSMMPIVGLLAESTFDDIDKIDLALDDFIILPLHYPELFSRITLATQRIRRVLDNNPLTRLPGNTSIELAIEAAVGKPMAVCYLDINNFKPYNDCYGFSRGDEVIRMTARIMSNVTKESCKNGFAGHIGGDDFVFIVPAELAEIICAKVIEHFEQIVSELFGEPEKSDGFYTAKNRKGETEKFPLLGIAIAIIPTDAKHISHKGKVAEVASELKKLAKKSSHSCYVVDRRKTEDH